MSRSWGISGSWQATGPPQLMSISCACRVSRLACRRPFMPVRRPEERRFRMPNTKPWCKHFPQLAPRRAVAILANQAPVECGARVHRTPATQRRRGYLRRPAEQRWLRWRLHCHMRLRSCRSPFPTVDLDPEGCQHCVMRGMK